MDNTLLQDNDKALKEVGNKVGEGKVLDNRVDEGE